VTGASGDAFQCMLTAFKLLYKAMFSARCFQWVNSLLNTVSSCTLAYRSSITV
jgi:hypothetical protein